MDRSQRIANYVRAIAHRRDVAELKLPEDVVESHRAAGGLESMAASNQAADANRALELIATGKLDQLTEAHLSGIEALVLPRERPAVPLDSEGFVVDHPLWRHLNKGQTRKTVWTWSRSVGRIEVPGTPYPYGGTGFVVAKNLVMTNRHVAQIFAHGVGDRQLDLDGGVTPGINLSYAPDTNGGVALGVRKVLLIHPYWDMAILQVEGLPADAVPLTLSSQDAAEFEKAEIAVIGYPAFDPRNDAADQALVMKGNYGVKQFQPGLLGRRLDTESFSKIVSAVGHDCSTLGGNSGSALIHMKTGAVVGLHFGGRYLATNYAVPMSELAKDGRVRDAGVAFQPSAVAAAVDWGNWWDAADQGEVEARAAAPAKPGVTPSTPAAGTGGSNTAPAPRIQDGVVSFTVPLHISIRLGDGAPTVLTTGESVSMEEKLVEPFRDTNYAGRGGFDERFLGKAAPMPRPKSTADLAPALDGGTILRYEHFSVAMHAKRRLALITASNVTAEPKLKKPEAKKLYTRKALGELGDSDQERWFLDPRMDQRFQLPDVFYTKDDGAFDKGHIVRREDVAWGTSYAELKRANGDTFHVTNCSPQVAGFNRSTLGDINWGELEEAILDQAADEKLVVFAGPVLAKDDPWFLGRMGGRERLKVQIPARFWKVIVAKTTDGLGAYGFVLEQDIPDDITTEFAVPERFAPKMTPLAEIGDMAGILFDAAAYPDQFDDRGVEVARRARVRRKRLR